MSSCSLADGILMTMLFQNQCTSIQFEKKNGNTLPSPLFDCVAILSEDNTYVHIIGGLNDKDERISTHMKTEVCGWLRIELKMEKEKENKNEMERIVNKVKKDNNVEH
ncbi:hypothetical protein RFI_37160 [Reticulomyxa filosa]|uniref:Uncharacterized protein n=1 Tax=Reticulomyxa filosa TaxID=46433 RepID=X6LGP1_RETFI|nr:hypothetical protein RFI_37160 [Reticulomyxa filosa]|eukprot:ETO00287.1 hypothetical protein RFI_37160 [Reticulomyxa filosa]